MMKKRLILLAFGKIIIPLMIGLLTLYSIGILLPDNSTYKYWVLVAAYFFPPFGKETIIPIGIYGGEIPVPFSGNIAVITPINPLLMALSIAFVDIIVALFLVWNYELAKKIPLIGKFIAKVEQIGKTSSGKYSWIKPLRFIGITLFVMVPFQGSGGLVGTILGRLIGMKPWNTFIGISIGAITGCLLIAYFTEIIKSVFIQDILMGIFIIILLLIIGVMILIYTKNQKKNNSKTS